MTGGNAGIGLVTAQRLAAEGAHVFVFGRREAELEKAVAEIGNATAVPGDVSVAADVDRLYERVRERGRGLDVLFANAGIQHLATLEELLHELLVQAVQTSRGLRILSVLHARHSVGHQVHFHDRELHRSSYSPDVRR